MKLTCISLLKLPVFSPWTHVPNSSLSRDPLRSSRAAKVLPAQRAAAESEERRFVSWSQGQTSCWSRRKTSQSGVLGGIRK